MSAHVGYPSFVKCCYDIIRNIPFGAKACIVDTQQGLIASFDINVARNHEVAIRTIEDDDIVLLDGILDILFHVLSVGLQDNNLSFEITWERVGVAATTCNVVGAGSIST